MYKIYKKSSSSSKRVESWRCDGDLSAAPGVDGGVVLCFEIPTL